ncbi:MAG: dethiobiotin synthase [Hyphomicrobium sp.]
MTCTFVVTGTDTNVGKTVFAAALAGALGASYWKPIQSGIEPETDSDLVRRLSGLPADKVLAEAYRFKAALSPHRAAELEGITIDAAKINPPAARGALVIEGAGGLMVPIKRELLFADVFARWELPVILCARTSLGTINHSLLSIEALRMRQIPILGIAFIGDENADNEGTICTIGSVNRLGRLPRLDPLNSSTLREAFSSSFRLEDFA